MRRIGGRGARFLDAIRVGRELVAIERRKSWTRADVERYQASKLSSILDYAARRSPYYRDFQIRNDALRLSDVQPLTKDLLLSHFDRIVTDASLRQDALAAFTVRVAETPKPIFFEDKYVVLLTGGTSGLRLVMPRERAMFSLQCAIAIARLLRAHDPHRRPRWATFTTSDNRHGSAATLRFMPSLFAAKTLVPAAGDFEAGVRALEAFRPTILTTYPSAALRLAAAKPSFRLSALVITGESSTAELRARLSEELRCPVRRLYAATEVGFVALECTAGRLHLNEDVLFVESVDEHDRAVPDEHLGRSLLVTHLLQRSVPLLRYRLDDQVSLSSAACSCRSPFRWIAAMEGRAGTELLLPGRRGGRVPVTGWRLNLNVLEDHAISGAQVAFAPPNRLRLDVIVRGSDADAVLARVRRIVERSLSEAGVDLGGMELVVRRVTELEKIAQSLKVPSVRIET